MAFHQPVLLAEVIQWINPREDDGIYCDCTVGGAGHLLALLKNTKNARFIGLDCDPEAIAYAQGVIMPYKKRCQLLEDNFINLGLILEKLKIKGLDGVLFDLGVSYHQLTTAERGFSFERDGRLSMQMSPKTRSLSEKIRMTTREEVIHILREYGDVHSYRKIGAEIYKNRGFLKTTLDLRKLLERTIPRRYLKKNLHKVFQALRIWTNDELINLKNGILTAIERLNLRGRILVISYHSGEDRIVKNIFRDSQQEGKLKVLTKKVQKASEDEIKKNPRARSAKLRVAEKCVSS
jgi:16S rRNA (cytosine1402-N4)-methyltransferase